MLLEGWCARGDCISKLWRAETETPPPSTLGLQPSGLPSLNLHFSLCEKGE